jgi:hypothetical protein
MNECSEMISEVLQKKKKKKKRQKKTGKINKANSFIVFTKILMILCCPFGSKQKTKLKKTFNIP